MPCVPRDLLLSPYDRLGASIFIHRIAVGKSEIHALTTTIAANLNYLFDYFGSIIVMLGSADFFTQLMLSTLQEKDGKVVVPSIGLQVFRLSHVVLVIIRIECIFWYLQILLEIPHLKVQILT